jgi:predicted GIY-YIG superfamily endonuclease
MYTLRDSSNWNGKSIKIPHIEVASCNRDDIAQAGIYFLFCKEDDGSDAVYIGEAENVKERLMQHLRDYQSEKETYYWNTAVIFIGRDLNKSLIRYLENRFVEIARGSKRYIVLTKNTYRNTVMKESQIAVMEEFVDNVKVVINTLGYKVFEPLVQTDSPATQIDDEKLFISTGSANAIGKVTTEGFVVFEGATVSDKTAAKSLSEGVRKLRQKYFDDGKVKNLVTTEDILFSSSSAAAAFLLGYSVSGPATWKTKDGRTLKDIEDSQTD